jgi:hypothetical protein
MMNKGILGLVVLAALVFLTSCRPATATLQPTPSHYWTALEAYEQIRPAMLDWHEDAVVVYISAQSDSSSNQYIRTDGAYFEWRFAVQSPSALKETEILLRGEEIIVGIDGISGYEFPIPSVTEGLPIDKMIDSEQAIAIALANDISKDSTLLRVQIEHYNSVERSYVPPSWGLTYTDPDNPSQEYRVFIDVVTGKVLRNDFTYTPPPPTPTSIRPPAADQLLIRAYGEFDLYVTNPQGRSLGIEPNSGEQIAEIPDAWYEMDSDIMTEDNVRLASALIMNPVEGRYRVQLHGPGEPEKRCRWSVEARKGTGEELLREVEVPCQGGVSLVYEFTLSLAGEELLSDVTLVEE